MRWFVLHLVTALFLTNSILAKGSPYKHEGILGAPVEDIRNMNSYGPAFLPYNPTVVEIGAYGGTGTVSFAELFPYGKIYAFEANPKAFAVLQEKVKLYNYVVPLNLGVFLYNGRALLRTDVQGGESKAYLQPRNSKHNPLGSDLLVPCVVLDDWCRQHDIRTIHLLRLDVGGYEYQILKSSPEILKTVLFVVTKTYLNEPRGEEATYRHLKQFLEKEGFELLAHWYKEKEEGEACFVRKHLYDSIWR